MNDDFSRDSFDDEDLDSEEAMLRRRKLRENAVPIAKPKITIVSIFLSVCLLSLVGAFGGFFAMPEKVVEVWPQTTAYYDRLGMHVKNSNIAPRPDVEIKPYASSMVAVGDVYKLTISGHIINRGRSNVIIPAIIATLENAAGSQIYTWSFCLPNRTLVRGQGVDYHYDLMAAPVSTATAIVEIKWERDADGQVIDTCPPIQP